MTYFSVPNRSYHNFFIQITKLFEKPLSSLHRLLILLYFTVVTICPLLYYCLVAKVNFAYMEK